MKSDRANPFSARLAALWPLAGVTISFCQERLPDQCVIRVHGAYLEENHDEYIGKKTGAGWNRLHIGA